MRCQLTASARSRVCFAFGSGVAGKCSRAACLRAARDLAWSKLIRYTKRTGTLRLLSRWNVPGGGFHVGGFQRVECTRMRLPCAGINQDSTNVPATFRKSDNRFSKTNCQPSCWEVLRNDSNEMSVWCRCGSRYVEGCWGFPHLKIQKLPYCHFMFFDRYEIHIQDVEDFLRGSSSFSGVRLRLVNFSNVQNLEI